MERNLTCFDIEDILKEGQTIIENTFNSNNVYADIRKNNLSFYLESDNQKINRTIDENDRKRTSFLKSFCKEYNINNRDIGIAIRKSTNSISKDLNNLDFSNKHNVEKVVDKFTLSLGTNINKVLANSETFSQACSNAESEAERNKTKAKGLLAISFAALMLARTLLTGLLGPSGKTIINIILDPLVVEASMQASLVGGYETEYIKMLNKYRFFIMWGKKFKMGPIKSLVFSLATNIFQYATLFIQRKFKELDRDEGKTFTMIGLVVAIILKSLWNCGQGENFLNMVFKKKK